MSRFLVMWFLFAIVTFLLGRFMGKFLYRRPAGRSERAGSGDELVQDPNCLTYVSKKTALAVRSGEQTHYFCGPACAAAFKEKQMKKEAGG